MRHTINQSRTVNPATVAKAIETYRKIEEYHALHREMPSMRDVVATGIAQSTSHVSALYDVMEELRMLDFTRRSGRRRTMSLLPLEEAHPLIVAEIEKSENEKE